MTEMEHVWERLNERAEHYAASGDFISLVESKAVVIAICRDEMLARPQANVIDYLAGELVRLTIEANEARET